MTGPFLQVWQLRGKYPNRGYPKIFNDETVGEEAKKLHTDALKLIDEIIANKTLTAKGVVGIWPANSVGDDIEVYDKSGAKLGTFHTLRQQEEREDSTYYAMSDFIAPKASGKTDYIGAFAVSAMASGRAFFRVILTQKVPFLVTHASCSIPT